MINYLLTLKRCTGGKYPLPPVLPLRERKNAAPSGTAPEGTVPNGTAKDAVKSTAKNAAPEGTAKDAERRTGFIPPKSVGMSLKRRIGLSPGFTLVEILLVVSLVSVVGLALYSAFSNSLNIWDKINRDVPAENIDIFFDRIALDLRNCFVFSGMNFEGNNSHIAFPAIIKIQTTSGAQEQIGQVSYLLDSRDNNIYRRQSNFSQVYQGKIGQERKWDSAVSSIRFYYYYYDSEDEEYYWLDSWESKGSGLGLEKKEEFPLSVRVQVTVKDGDSEQVFTRTISIPFSHYTPRKES